MKRFIVLSLLLTVIACSTAQPDSSRNTSLPGHGAITIAIQPNPIVARNVGGSTYEFPFDVIVRETGGRAVTINRVSMEVYAVGGIKVGSEAYDGARIRQLGFSTNIPGNGELRYHFAPRQSVQDDRLFGSVYGEVRVDASDETGTPTSATTRITLTR
jgi:hypothetical protein